MSDEFDEHNCTVDEFDAWCDRLGDLLMECAPTLCDGTTVDVLDRSMRIEFYGRQVKRLLDELTLLAEYKASTEAARRRSQDPEFMAAMHGKVTELNAGWDRSLLDLVERRRREDPDFVARIRARAEADRELLNRLADS